jgi:hypothetical protein
MAALPGFRLGAAIGRGARRAAAPAGGEAAAGRAADQPAARHRRRALHAAGRRHAGLRHGFPQPGRRAAADGMAGRLHLRYQARGLLRGAGRRGRALGLPEVHLYRHRHPRHRARPRGDAADGRRPAPRLCRGLGRGRRAGGAGGLPAGGAARRASLHRPLLRSHHLHDLRDGRAWKHARRLPRGLPDGRDRLHRQLLVEHRDELRRGLRLLHRGDLRAAARLFAR